MKKILWLLLSLPLFGQTVAITGTFHYPDATVVRGRVVISLTRSTVTNTCATPAQVLSFRTVTKQIVNGVMQALSLYPTPCLKPQLPYTVKVYDAASQILYTGSWTVPKTAADVTELGQK